MKETRRNTIVCWFCGVFIITILILAGYLCYSCKIFKGSQNSIVNEHIKHIEKVDSIFNAINAVISHKDSVAVAHAQVLLTQIQKDSALFKRELLLSQEEMNNLTTLHIEKIDNEYAQIGIWGGLLSVVFLIFGFFAIFKIEETKTEARNVLEDVKGKGSDAKNVIKELQNQAVELNNSLTLIRQEGDSFIYNKTKEFENLTKNIYTAQTQSNTNLDRINKLLNDVEYKNKQYNASIEASQKQTKLFSDLINELREILKNKEKENTNDNKQ